MAKRTGGFIGQDGINAPDQATGVEASAGDGQVEVSFTAPSDVGGAAITGYQVQSNNGDGTIPPSIGNASYDGVSFSSASQDGTPFSLFFKPTGDVLYVLGYSNDTVYQYTLSTAWDISTASYASKSFSVGSQDTTPYQIFFKPDGTKMYMVGTTTDTVYQYTLSTAWDVSTTSYDSVSFSVSSQETAPTGLWFKDDGTKMYIYGQVSADFFQYSLSTAWDLSTASYDSVSYAATAAETGNRNMCIVNNGYSLFTVGADTDTIYQHTMSTAWDLSTASYSGNSFSVNAQDSNPTGLFFKDDETKMYMVGITTDNIYQYTTNLYNYPTSSPVTVTGLTNGTSYTFNVWAINPFGWSSPSDASGGVTPVSLTGRAIWNGNTDGSNSAVMQYFLIPTTGNAADFGDLTVGRRGGGGMSSSTRSLASGGTQTGVGNINVIDFVEFATLSNATDFGDLTVNSGNGASSGSSSTRGIHALGSGSSNSNVIQYNTIASAGNATDFGDASPARDNVCGGCSNGTRLVFGGGGYSISGGGSQSKMEYITIASTGNSTDFGDLASATFIYGMSSNSTRGIVARGTDIQYITIASTGNSTTFGTLSPSRGDCTSVSDSTRCVMTGSGTNDMDYVTIASTGNSTDFGDLYVEGQQAMGTSNAHGGLQ